MKILYIANERRAAGLAAQAVHGIAPNVTLTWAQTLSSALHWLQDNRDTAAVIVEHEVQGQGCTTFVEQVRGMDRALPLVIVAPEQLGAPVAALEAGADDYVIADASLQADLPRVVRGVLQRRRAAQESEGRWASELATVAARLADGDARHKAALSREARICRELQIRLIELEAAVRTAEERRASDAAGAADQLARRHAEFTASLAQAAQWRDDLAQKLNAAMAALDQAREARASETVAAAEHLARREAELGAALAEAVAARTTLEQSLARAEAMHQRARQRAEADVTAAAALHSALEDRLAREADRRASAERKTADSEASRRQSEGRHAAEMAAAARQLADLQARFDAALNAHAQASTAFEQQMARAAAILETTRQERAADATAAAEALARRESELGTALAEVQAAKAAVELALADARAAHRDAQRRAAADLAAAGEREARLGRQLADEAAARTAVERERDDSRTESARTRRRLLHVVSEHRRRARDRQAHLEARLTDERAVADRTLAAKSDHIRRVELERDSLQRLLDSARERLQHLHATLEEERQAHERTRLTGECELQRLSVEHEQLRGALDQLQTAFNTLERVAAEHAAERARLETIVADRDAQLNAQAERHLAAEQAAQQALTQLQDRLRLALETSSGEIARLQREIDGLRQELASARTYAEAMRIGAEQVPVLQVKLEETQKEKRRQFERAPYGLCVCTPDGVIAHANHTLVQLLGYRRADDLRRIDVAATVFEDASELRWLIERSASTGRSESIETTWKTKDRRRLAVRLQALATANGSIEIVVEDITHVRALEQRLRQAHRMEAVGRLASEVAVTCDRLLRDAARAGEQLFAIAGGDGSLRHQGEMLLGDVTRAASLLRQLAVYGNQQTSALEPVNVHRVLRDLEPVLKRVAGDEINLVLPRSSSPADVDVDGERVERILVNVASYARGRMPYGGQVRIDVAATVVGRKFIARYPNVRPGPHVVVTVTELRRPTRPEGMTDQRDDRGGSTPRGSSGNPGVDLGVLLELVGTCGGHLWMEAEPAGNMTLKIHLPKRPAEDLGDPAAAAARSERGLPLSRWFRSNSPAATAGT